MCSQTGHGQGQGRLNVKLLFDVWTLMMAARAKSCCFYVFNLYKMGYNMGSCSSHFFFSKFIEIRKRSNALFNFELGEFYRRRDKIEAGFYRIDGPTEIIIRPIGRFYSYIRMSYKLTDHIMNCSFFYDYGGGVYNLKRRWDNFRKSTVFIQIFCMILQ